jgi:type II secretory pathway component PulF
LLRAGVAIGEALQSMREAGHSKPLDGALSQMQKDIEEGMPLWKSLDRSGIVSGQTLALVRLGEQAGKLVENLQVAAKQEEKQRIFRSKVRSALLYPTFVLSVTGIVGIAVSWFLLPRLAATFSQLKLNLPLISRILIDFGIFLQGNGIWAIPTAIGVIIVLSYVLFGAPQTKGLGQYLLFHIPGISKLLYEVEVARFGYLLGTLLQAGLSVTQALQLLHDASSSVRYKKFYLYLKDSFEEGYSFKTSLANYKKTRQLIPPAVQQMIIAGERSGALPETLLSAGEIYEEKADISTQNLEVILEPILLVIVASGVLMVAIAVILPIYSLVGGLNGA